MIAAEFGPLALKAVRGELIKSGLCRSEVNKRVGRIVRAFKWAVGEELVLVCGAKWGGKCIDVRECNVLSL